MIRVSYSQKVLERLLYQVSTRLTVETNNCQFATFYCVWMNVHESGLAYQLWDKYWQRLGHVRAASAAFGSNEACSAFTTILFSLDGHTPFLTRKKGSGD
jgi:hypothetical protein